MAKVPTMLIDISDLLQVNVFIVGATYLKLVKDLCLTGIPLIDPSIYISRFASLLEFGPDTHKVAYDAARLIKRFDHDWLSSGRRPAGLVGASILIAARMNGFRRSVLEIVQVVKMADVTIKKRLQEFKTTESGSLTVEEFRTVWLDTSENPPAFTRNRKLEALDRDPSSPVETEAEIASILKRTGTPYQESINPHLNLATKDHQSKRRKLDDVNQFADVRWGESVADTESVVEEVDFENDPTPISAQDQNNAIDDWLDKQIVEPAITHEVESHLRSGAGSLLQTELDDRDRADREAVARLIAEESSFNDLDDEELDSFILSEREVEIKTRVWMDLNREYLDKLAEKKEREASGDIRPTKKYPSKGKMKPRDSDNPAGATVEESVRNMIASKKKLSSRINYEIADSLFGSSKNRPNKKQRGKNSSSKTTASGQQSSTRDSAPLLGSAHSVENNLDDDDDDEQEEEEEEDVGDLEFEMMKRDSRLVADEDDDGWGEV